MFKSEYDLCSLFNLGGIVLKKYTEYINKNFQEEISAHYNSSCENNLCSCDFENESLCLIGLWLEGNINSKDFLIEKEIVDCE